MPAPSGIPTQRTSQGSRWSKEELAARFVLQDHRRTASADDMIGRLNWPILGGLWCVWPCSTRLSTDLLLSRASSYSIRPPDRKEDTTGPTDSTPAALTLGSSFFPGQCMPHPLTPSLRGFQSPDSHNCAPSPPPPSPLTNPATCDPPPHPNFFFSSSSSSSSSFFFFFFFFFFRNPSNVNNGQP